MSLGDQRLVLFQQLSCFFPFVLSLVQAVLNGAFSSVKSTQKRLPCHLPEKERQAWRSLWSQVEEALR